jgi:uncharacterized membrane protein
MAFPKEHSMSVALRRWYPALLIAATAVVSAVRYEDLPDSIPVHWAADGQVNAWGDRLTGALMIPILIALIWGVSALVASSLPETGSGALGDPENGLQFPATRKQFAIVINAVLTALAVWHIVVIGALLHWWPAR